MIKALRGYVLIQPIDDEDKTSVGVYLPQTSRDKPMKGKIIDIGDPSLREHEVIGYARAVEDHKRFENEIVYYKRWGNEEIKENGKEYVFVKFDDILGVLEE